MRRYRYSYYLGLLAALLMIIEAPLISIAITEADLDSALKLVQGLQAKLDETFKEVKLDYAWVKGAEASEIETAAKAKDASALFRTASLGAANEMGLAAGQSAFSRAVSTSEKAVLTTETNNVRWWPTEVPGISPAITEAAQAKPAGTTAAQLEPEEREDRNQAAVLVVQRSVADTTSLQRLLFGVAATGLLVLSWSQVSHAAGLQSSLLAAEASVTSGASSILAATAAGAGAGAAGGGGSGLAIGLGVAVLAAGAAVAVGVGIGSGDSGSEGDGQLSTADLSGQWSGSGTSNLGEVRSFTISFDSSGQVTGFTLSGYQIISTAGTWTVGGEGAVTGDLRVEFIDPQGLRGSATSTVTGQMTSRTAMRGRFSDGIVIDWTLTK